ncbi:MAG: hypothetical protein ACK4NX_02235, partial [Candidatus Paceibacteria bacterium]
TLLTAATLVALFRAPVQEDFSYTRVYQLQLTQDFLETTTRNQAVNELLIQFLNENQQAKMQLQSIFDSLLKQTGAVCFVLKTENKHLETSQCTKTSNYVSAQAIAFDNQKNRFVKLIGTTYFR